jgi:hypothetical protein
LSEVLRDRLDGNFPVKVETLGAGVFEGDLFDKGEKGRVAQAFPCRAVSPKVNKEVMPGLLARILLYARVARVARWAGAYQRLIKGLPLRAAII